MLKNVIVYENGVVAFDLPVITDDSINAVLSDNTMNSWQPDRTPEERKQDTDLGKLGEYVVLDYFCDHIPGVQYISYDSFRADGCKKSAPFDALLVWCQQKYLDKIEPYISRINKEVELSVKGKMKASTRYEMQQNMILTAEIKTTRVSECKKKGVSSEAELIEKIREQDDYLMYPYLTRHSSISSFDEYLELYRRKYGAENVTIEKVIEQEWGSASLVQIRVYIDEEAGRGYIMGYSTSVDIAMNRTIKHFLSKKSKDAVYLTLPLTMGQPISEVWEGFFYC